MLNIGGLASSAAISSGTMAGSVLADPTSSREPLVKDLTVTNVDHGERTFRLTAVGTSSNTKSVAFQKEVTLASGEKRTFKKVFPRGKGSRLDVELNDGRTASRNATVVGNMPLLYGLEVAAKPELLAVYSRHIDPGPNEWGDY